jgi:hypothetical protein
MNEDLAHRRSDGDGMVLDAAGRSDFFWDASRLRAPYERQQKIKAEADAHIAMQRSHSHVSAISQLTAEQSDLSDQNDEFDDAEEEGPEKKMTCRRCGSKGFSARRGMDGVALFCENCGLRLPVGKAGV